MIFLELSGSSRFNFCILANNVIDEFVKTRFILQDLSVSFSFVSKK